MKPLLFSLVCAALGIGATQVRIPGPGGATGPSGAPSEPCTPAGGYSYCRVLTINSAQVGGSDLSDFGVLVSTTLGASRIQNANCDDVVFTSDSGGSSLIPWEQESCTPSTGKIIDWVGLASISASANTLFYISYGNGSISTPRNTGSFAPAKVWDANYASVWHLGNGTTLSASDSTSNSNMGTATASSAISGEIGGGATLDGSGAYIIGSNTFNSSSATVSAWVYLTSYPSANAPVVSGLQGNGTGSFDKSIIINASGQAFFYYYNGNQTSTSASSPIGTGAWVYLTGVVTPTNGYIYVNGAQVGSAAAGGSFTGYGGPNMVAGGHDGSEAPNYISGAIDEVRFSNVVRSPGWITAEYNNQSPGSSFVTVGGEY
jgi:Concanavalin A-like lectin/glucanases superfamily